MHVFMLQVMVGFYLVNYPHLLAGCTLDEHGNNVINMEWKLSADGRTYGKTVRKQFTSVTCNPLPDGDPELTKQWQSQDWVFSLCEYAGNDDIKVLGITL
jgi:hypothetical protein